MSDGSDAFDHTKLLFKNCPDCGQPMAMMRGFSMVKGVVVATEQSNRCFVCNPPKMRRVDA